MRRHVGSIGALVLVAIASSLAVGTAVAATSLDANERATLLAMREEEKLAHDVYVSLAEKTGLTVFTRIAASEERHGKAVERALAAYGVADPTDGYAVGTFPTAAVQQLYDSLVAKGSASKAAAVEVGLQIERTDIADLKAAIAATDEPMLDRVYGNLLEGSTRHLAAFERVSANSSATCPRDGTGAGPRGMVLRGGQADGGRRLRGR